MINPTTEQMLEWIEQQLNDIRVFEEECEFGEQEEKPIIQAIHDRLRGHEPLLQFVHEVKSYTAPWAVNDVAQPEVFRKAMLNIHEDACKAIDGTYCRPQGEAR